jgi:hypothetical protein
MKKIKLFLASSKELKPEREQFELEIYRKCKAWFDKDIFLHLDIWEDLSARMSVDGSQAEYNKYVQAADLFVLLAHNKVGMYTAAEFETAFGQFESTKKPFIFTYFKANPKAPDASLDEFKQKIHDLEHFYSPFTDFNDLWNQFNKELERLENNDFSENKKTQQSTRYIQQGNKSVYVEKADNMNINIQ